eukprot:COSAG06_NODE_32277_length_508_cov_11.051345_2_plen_71_part_00
MQELWGGPPPKFWEAALESWPDEHVSGAGKAALITGSSGGIGLCVTHRYVLFSVGGQLCAYACLRDWHSD